MTVVREHRFPKLMAMTIASSAQNAVAAGAHTLEKQCQRKAVEKAVNDAKAAFLATNPYYITSAEVIAVPTDGHRAPYTSKRSSLANSALSEMKANLASALVPIRRSTESAVPARSSANSTTRSMVRLAGSMVVSFSCAGIISPRPLEAADINLHVRSIVLHRFA